MSDADKILGSWDRPPGSRNSGENARDDALMFAIKAQRSLGMKGDSWDNYAVARDTLNGDLGLAGKQRDAYNLDQNTRDILLAHARQDAAHALCNSISLLNRIKNLNRVIYCLTVLIIVLILINLLGWRI